jgi:hypothetical protein
MASALYGLLLCLSQLAFVVLVTQGQNTWVSRATWLAPVFSSALRLLWYFASLVFQREHVLDSSY